MAKSLHSQSYTALVTLLREIRVARGLTQQMVAERLDKPQSYVAKVESSERRIDVPEFVALVRAMGADPIEVFTVFTEKLP